MSYIENLLDCITQNPGEPGTVRHVYVRQDDACPILKGRKKCTCKNPVVKIGEAPAGWTHTGQQNAEDAPRRV